LQGLPDVRKRAMRALEESQIDQRKRIEESGFSRLLAEQIAKQAPGTNAAQNLGMFESFQAGLATQGGSLAEFMINEIPKAFATELGALIGGASVEEANKLGRSQLLSGDSLADLNKASGIANQFPGWAFEVLRWISK